MDNLPDEVMRKIRYLPKAIQEDAFQEAWIGFLEGGIKGAISAVRSFEYREKKWRKRHKTNIDIDKLGGNQ